MSGPGNPFDDRELVARIAAGEERAFVIAYDRHAHFAFSSVVRFLVTGRPRPRSPKTRS